MSVVQESIGGCVGWCVVTEEERLARALLLGGSSRSCSAEDSRFASVRLEAGRADERHVSAYKRQGTAWGTP
jgi:hypothetical protein